jgi:hypothetical protein
MELIQQKEMQVKPVPLQEEQKSELKSVDLIVVSINYNSLDVSKYKGFEEYFVLDNNIVVKDKFSLIPFTGKIMGYNNNGQLEKEFDFLNGFAQQVTVTYWEKRTGNIWYKARNDILYFINKYGKIEYDIRNTKSEQYSYYDNGKLNSSSITDNEVSTIIKEINYDLEGNKESEGYIGWTTIPGIEHGEIHWHLKRVKLGHWIYYNDNGEIYKEEDWGIINKQVDLQTYNFHEDD